MGRILFIFASGTVCGLVAVIAIVGHWALAAVVLAVGSVVVLLWGVVRGTGGKRVSEADPTDADLERAKTAQYYMRNKSQPPGGAL
jgi:hypothetical protein